LRLENTQTPKLTAEIIPRAKNVKAYFGEGRQLLNYIEDGAIGLLHNSNIIAGCGNGRRGLIGRVRYEGQAISPQRSKARRAVWESILRPKRPESRPSTSLPSSVRASRISPSRGLSASRRCRNPSQPHASAGGSTVRWRDRKSPAGSQRYTLKRGRGRWRAGSDVNAATTRDQDCAGPIS
jgi:hypothetical protein